MQNKSSLTGKYLHRVIKPAKGGKAVKTAAKPAGKAGAKTATKKRKRA